MLIKFTSNYKITGTRFSPNRDENPETLKNLLIALDIFTLLSNYSDEKLDFSQLPNVLQNLYFYFQVFHDKRFLQFFRGIQHRILIFNPENLKILSEVVGSLTPQHPCIFQSFQLFKFLMQAQGRIQSFKGMYYKTARKC